MESNIKFGLVEDWQDNGAAPQQTTMTVGFSMKTCPHMRAQLEEYFWQVSDPQHSNYGKYLSREEVMEFIAASDDDLDLVINWLHENSAIDVTVSPNKDLIHATFSVSTLEDILQTTFHTFSSKKYALRVPRIIAPYSLPEDIAEVVALVDGITLLPGIRALHMVPSVGAPTWEEYCPGGRCTGKLTPNVTAQLYNSLPLTPDFKPAAGNGVAVAEFQGQKYTEKDLQKFADGCNIPVINVTDVNGNAQGRFAGVETMLDLEYISGNGLGLPLSNYYADEYSLINLANQINSQKKEGAALVYSVSYGNDERQQTSAEYMYQCNTAFMTAGTLGYSILFASGDQGVWGRSGFGKVFHPDFPGGSPYITVVGGTDFSDRSPTIGDEEICSTMGGGGFSDTFATPSYQSAAVAGFIKTAGDAGVLPDQSYWNATGRAYPDISASFGGVIPYCILANGLWEGVGGTSASCPTVAHGIGILNNLQLGAGKAPLGFLNPWLYQTLAGHPDAFNDITSGMNNNHIGKGFTAVKGWDACSGVGTPNFEKMAAYLP